MIEAILRYEFLQNAMITGLIIGVIAPLLGAFIVVRRLSLIADALSHVTLAGVAAGLYAAQTFVSLAWLNPLYVGMAFSLLGSIFIERLRNVYRHYQELAIPIILSGGVGVGVIFISLADGFNTDLFSYLFGSVSAVSRNDLFVIIVIAVLVMASVFLLYKELFLLSFDEEHAKASGIPVRTIHFVFMLLVALVIAASMRIVGVLLVSALMTLPVAASIRIARGFKQTIAYSVLFGEIAVIIGLVSAFYLDLAPGGTIVVSSIMILLIVISFKKLSKPF
ncbi:metal ABC transporter permease [Bacillus xiapuensis]|uniref:metal ABC transporter permease n=1 Tax=Bacillus xiapuensis TaxID=2014075 RepID=UPI000C24A2FE|nr:metal ABC transporter permease [Bacillus xiapuensis]